MSTALHATVHVDANTVLLSEVVQGTLNLGEVPTEGVEEKSVLYL